MLSEAGKEQESVPSEGSLEAQAPTAEATTNSSSSSNFHNATGRSKSGKRQFIRKNDPTATTFTLIPRTKTASAAGKRGGTPAPGDGVAGGLLNSYIPHPASRNRLRRQPECQAEEQARQHLSLFTIPELADDGEEEEEVHRAAPSAHGVEPGDEVDAEAAAEMAVQYGIYFPDQAHYDYLQHLRPIGEDPQAVYVASKLPVQVVVEDTPEGALELMHPGAPLANSNKSRGAAKDTAVQETLQALEDEAYLEEDLDDFFTKFHDDHVRSEEENGADALEGGGERAPAPLDAGWMEDFRKFQLERKAGPPAADRGLRKLASRLGGSRAGGSAGARTARTGASGMSASSMYRNQQLELLDDRFDRLLAGTYGEVLSDDMAEDGSDVDLLADGSEALSSADDDDEAEGDRSRHLRPHHGHHREDVIIEEEEEEEVEEEPRGWMEDDDERLDAMMNEFLASHSIVGERTQRVMAHKNDPIEDMRRVREELRDFARAYLARPGADLSCVPERPAPPTPDKFGCYPEGEGEAPSSEDEAAARPDDHLHLFREKEEVQWDVQSVLSTYSNLYNHPSLLAEPEAARRRASKKGTRIVLTGKHRMPMVVAEEEEEEVLDEAAEERVNMGVSRPKHEDRESKAARKAAVKQAKANRRQEKKETKLAFKQEVGLKKRVMGDAPILKTIPL